MKIKEIQALVRDWIATLSVDELVVNKELAKIFKEIEAILYTSEIPIYGR